MKLDFCCYFVFIFHCLSLVLFLSFTILIVVVAIMNYKLLIKQSLLFYFFNFLLWIDWYESKSINDILWKWKIQKNCITNKFSIHKCIFLLHRICRCICMNVCKILHTLWFYRHFMNKYLSIDCILSFIHIFFAKVEYFSCFVYNYFFSRNFSSLL